jgi:hypothetical protein
MLLLLLATPVFGDFSDFFSAWSEAFSGLSDPNTGLTMYPSLLIPLGGRYEGMGTAYTAIADDTTLLEVNPAGSCELENAKLSFFHHNWIADSAIEAVAFATKMGSFGVGVAGKFFYIPFTEYDDAGERAEKGYFSETTATLNASINLLSIRRVASLSIGANVKGIYRHIPDVFALDQSAFSLLLDFGILSRFHLFDFSGNQDTNLSLGTAFKNLGPNVYHLDHPLPTVLSAGLAYSPAAAFTLSTDVHIPISFDSARFPAERISIAAGINVLVASFLSLHGGVHLKTDNPKFSIGSSLDLGMMSFVVNYNVDLMGRMDPLDKFSVAATLELGRESVNESAKEKDSER